MREYYCYVYYDESWNAYYVGKGKKFRCFYRADGIPVADHSHTQVFQGMTEWEAFELETELINFWGRKTDGGCLLNVCLGGAGAPGRKMSRENKLKLLAARPSPTQEQIDVLVARSSKPICLQNIQSGEVLTFTSCADAARATGISQSSARALRTGIFKTCKGWRLTNA
jgi:hypothetical protein